MNKYLKKQLIIGGILFLILLIFGLVIYLLVRPTPSCFDKIQNQGEEGIDCGGPCISCEVLNLKKIQILTGKFIEIEPQIYDVVVKIKNPNFNYGAPKLIYKFNFYNANNELIQTIDDESFILPNQVKYLVKNRIKINGIPVRLTITFKPITWKKISDFTYLNFPIIDKVYSLNTDGIGFSQLSAKIINKTNFNFRKVEIKGVLLDKLGTILAINKTEVNDFLSNETREFRFFWSKSFSGEVASSDIIADTNIFLSENFIKSTEEGIERFQE